MGASNDCFSYVSEPTSPTKCGKEAMFFYSVPVSPGFCPSPSQPTTPWALEDVNSSFDDFEFETSRRLNLNDIDIDRGNSSNFDQETDMEKKQEKQGTQLGTPLPVILFADELFCNGKVLPLLPPLKLPPRLQRENAENNIKKSATATSPRSPISVLKSKFSRSNLFESNFDPFTVALENVREGGGRKPLETKYRRSSTILGLQAHEKINMIPNSPPPDFKAMGLKPMGISSWTDPKGLTIARKVRLVRMGFESNMGPLEGPKTNNDNPKEMKGEQMRKSSLFRILSIMRKPTFFRS